MVTIRTRKYGIGPKVFQIPYADGTMDVWETLVIICNLHKRSVETQAPNLKVQLEKLSLSKIQPSESLGIFKDGTKALCRCLSRSSELFSTVVPPTSPAAGWVLWINFTEPVLVLEDTLGFLSFISLEECWISAFVNKIYPLILKQAGFHHSS